MQRDEKLRILQDRYFLDIFCLLLVDFFSSSKYIFVNARIASMNGLTYDNIFQIY